MQVTSRICSRMKFLSADASKPHIHSDDLFYNMCCCLKVMNLSTYYDICFEIKDLE